MFIKKFISLVTKSLFATFMLLTIANCHFQPPKQSGEGELNLPQENKLTSKVYIDDKFSGPERNNILKGLRAWEDASNGVIKFIVTDRGSWDSDKEFIDVPQPDPETHLTSCTKDVYIVRTYSTDKIVTDIEGAIKEQTNENVRIAGYTNLTCTSKWLLLVADTLDNDEQYIIVTVHEMGHMLGLRHVKLENMTIMYPGLSYSAVCITQVDTDQLCRKWNCDRTKMKPCSAL